MRFLIKNSNYQIRVVIIFQLVVRFQNKQAENSSTSVLTICRARKFRQTIEWLRQKRFRKFLSHEKFVRGPFWFLKVSDIETRIGGGGYQDFLKFFCLAVPTQFVGDCTSAWFEIMSHGNKLS